jgi:preprotein translocase subunit SecE
MARTRRKKQKDAIARELDPRRWAYLIFVLGGFLGAWVLGNLFDDGWALLWSYWPQYFGRPVPLYANLAGIGIAIVATIWALRKEHWFKFTTEVVVEISQVTWPTRAETRAATIVVVIITLICSGLLATMDVVWSKATDLLYGI